MKLLPLFSRELGGSGRPAVILHGMLGSSRNWITAGKDLADRGLRVFALDMRNHGNSPHAAEMDYEAMAADVAAWLESRVSEPVRLIGHSMGGKVAMRLACDRPEKVGELVVVDIAPKDYRWAGHRMEFAAMMGLDLADLKSRAEAEMRMEGQVPDWAMRKFLTTNLDRGEDGRWRWTVGLDEIAAALPKLEKNPLREGDRFEGPAHFIAGGRSRYVSPADDLPKIKSFFPQARLTILPESGHNPHFDAREAFVNAVSSSN